MLTVQQVFDAAIHMMDEQYELNGNTVTADTNEYKYRTISILNTVMPALYPFSDTYTKEFDSGRPMCPMLAIPESYKEPDFEQMVPLDDTLAYGVLPYALAAHLLAAENAELSAWFLSRYTQVFADIRSKIPAEFEPISTPYGTF